MGFMRIAVAGIALCIGASAAQAQGAPPSNTPQGGAERQRGMRGGMRAALFEGITLTQAQQKQVDAIYSKYSEERRALRPDGRGSDRPDDATRSKMRDLQQRQNAEVRAILSAEQQVVFDKNVAERQRRIDQRGATRT